jgi:hypothetical protein
MEFAKNNNWHVHQNDPDNWIQIPEFNVLPQNVNFEGFAYPIMGPTTNDGWQARVCVWGIVKAVRFQARKRFESLSKLKVTHSDFLDRVGIFDKEFTDDVCSDEEVFAFRYESIFYNLDRFLTHHKKDKISSIIALARASSELAEMMLEKPIDGEAMREIRSRIGKSGAYAKLATDPKQKDKALARECWDEWRKQPDRYSGKAAFARDMRDKFTSLESQPVIERWCREWERKTLTPPAQ